MSKELDLSLSKVMKFCYKVGISDAVSNTHRDEGFDPYKALAANFFKKSFANITYPERFVTKHLVWSAMYEKSEENFLTETKMYAKEAHIALDAAKQFEAEN